MEEAPKRRSRRLPTKLPGALSGRTRQEVEVLDLSITGCLVRCQTPLDPGLVVDLEIQIGFERLCSKARVVQTSLNGESMGSQPEHHLIGLSFLALPSADEYRLRLFLENQRKKRPPES